MNNIGSILFKFSFALLATIGIQAVVQSFAVNEPFLFQNYTFFGWIIQIIYWIGSFGAAIHISTEDSN